MKRRQGERPEGKKKVQAENDGSKKTTGSCARTTRTAGQNRGI